MSSTHKTIEAVLAVLHAQGSKKISLEVLAKRCTIVDDWHVDGDDRSFPCVTLNNGVRWFYDRDARPLTKSGASMKALSPTGKRSFLGDLEGDGDLVIFEGERDWFTALSIGLSDAICAGGADNVDEQQRHFMARRNKIIVFYDNDEAGQTAARKLCAQLVDIGAGEVKNAVPPVAGQDFSEWVETLPGDEACGIVLKKIREAEKMGKREAKKVLREQSEEDAPPPMSDEFKTPDGDLVTLTYQYRDPEAPHDQEQPVDIRFAHFDVEASRRAGVRVVNFSDVWEYTPAAVSDQAPMYDAEDTPHHAPELPAIVRPLTGDWAKERVILFPTGCENYGTSEELFDDILNFIDRYYVCDEAFRHAMAAYVLLTYRYRDAGFESVPYIRVMGAPGYGKTRFLRVMRELSYRAAMLTSMRPPHLYRLLAQMKSGVTLVLEELNVNEKTEDGREFVNLLNAGNQRGTPVPRMTGHNFSDMEFLPVFCPKAMTLKTEFSDTGMIRRCITGYAVPREIPKSKRFARLPDPFYAEADMLRRRLLDWRFAKFLEGAPAESDEASNGLNMGIWQNWYPVVSMVPESRPKAKDSILALAAEAEGGLAIAHQASNEALVLTSCIKNKDPQGRAWVHLVLSDLNETDRNARWQRADVLRIARALGIKPTRSKVRDGEGGFTNEFFIRVDAELEAVISRFKFEIELLDGGSAASTEVM